MEPGNGGKALCSVRAWGKGLGEGSGGGGEGGRTAASYPTFLQSRALPGSGFGHYLHCRCEARGHAAPHAHEGRACGERRGAGLRERSRGGSLCRAVSPRSGAAPARRRRRRRRRPGASPAAPGHPDTATQRRPTARSAPYPQGRAAPSGPADRPPPPPPPRVVPSRRGSTKGRSGGERGGARTRGPAGGRGGAMQMRPRSPMASARAAAPTRSRAAAAAPGPPRRGFEPRPRRPAPHRRSMGRGRGGSCGRDMAGGRGCPARR